MTATIITVTSTMVKEVAKTLKKGVSWRVTFEGASPSENTRIWRCFAQKQQVRCSAVSKLVKVCDGIYDLTWKGLCGYKSVYSWLQSALTTSRKQFSWSLDLAPDAGAAPAEDMVPGAPPDPTDGTVSGAAMSAPAGSSDGSVSGASPQPPGPLGASPQQDQAQVHKKVRMSTKGSASLRAGAAESGKGEGGASPPCHSESQWYVQRALKIYCGVALYDPAAADYDIARGEKLCSTLHSSAYLVQSPKHGKLVVKALHKDSRITMVHEVDYLTRLRHPNIVCLVDVANIDGRCCMVTPHGGPDLLRLIHGRKGVAPYPSLGLLFEQLLSAMSYVHSHLVVHSDLKPSNIVVDDAGVLRLIDFGCAFVDSPGHRTMRSFDCIEEQGIPYGTLPYRSIEVILGKKDFGMPMDIWAIGCILFELVVCSRLFVGSSIGPDDVAKGCFALLGQHDKVGILAHLPHWKPRLLVEKSPADFWCRIQTSPAGKAYGCFAYSMLNFDDTMRPTMIDLSKTWKSKGMAVLF